MDFVHYITTAISDREPNKNIYGQVVSNYYSLDSVRFADKVEIVAAKYLDVYFDKKENRLDIEFILLYKRYTLAEINIELYKPSNYNSTVNQKKVTSIQNSVKKLEGIFDTVSRFELSNGNIILQANNEKINVQLQSDFERLNLDIDFTNTVSYIDAIEKRERNSELFYTICNTITDEQLTTIAQADYGYGEDIASQELLTIRGTRNLPTEISYETSEVLSLTKYSDPETTEEHQERLFACAAILLEEDALYTMDGVEHALTGLFLSAITFESKYVAQARAFFLNILATHKLLLSDIHTIAYLILGCDLLLKDERYCDSTLVFFQETYFLEELDFEYSIALAAKRIKQISLVMLENTSFIQNKSLKNGLSDLIKSTIQICEERYDTTAIGALFERTFSKEEQEKYLELLPELLKIEYKDRGNYLIKRGLNGSQVAIITRSLSDAQHFIEGSCHEVKLKTNIFFDAWVKIYKKDLRTQATIKKIKRWARSLHVSHPYLDSPMNN